MRIKYSERALRDSAWFRQYYGSVFPAGRENAAQSLINLQSLLKVHPYIGQRVPNMESVRRMPIPKTPFVLIYRVTETQIEVLRLRDSRQGRDG
ncbi:type II toxin-antitoxin system RelE/ParE family toxin [uncultured Sulfitobacter sp.]|uniref:type II toxin-antitoxin system RelE/ParE family toxin n=1 Tax=uncultured Sulfitobacter sp. TaxID=191468 RepID=UPI00345C6910